MKYNINKTYEKDVLMELQKALIEILEDFSRVCKKHNLKFFAVYGTAIGAVRHNGFIPWDDDLDVGMLRADYDRFMEIIEVELGEKYQIMTPLKNSNYTCTVTHLQRKGTRFVAQYAKKLKCDMCIDIDIFPFDVVAPTVKGQRTQLLKTTLYGKLLFLSGNPYPLIKLNGIKGILAKSICWMTHYALKLLHINGSLLYRKYLKAATMYNGRNDKYVTNFENAGSIKQKLRKSEMMPIREVAFEHTTIPLLNNNHQALASVYGDYMELPPKNQRVNHCPYMIQFEGKQPIIFE